MRRKNGFVAQLIYKDCFAGRAFYLLQENRKRGQDKDMPICVVFFPIAESMGDRAAIWRPIRNGRHLTRQKGSIFSRARREEVQRHNEQVRQNRETLKTISEAVLFLSKQELAFRGHDESNDGLNKGNYWELLECFAKFDSVFERRLHRELTEDERVHSGVFTGTSSEVQNDLIECIDSVIQDQIDKEIENCRFLNIQVDETTDVSTKEQLSVIIRLDKEDEIVERFLKLFDVSSDRSHYSLVVGS